MSHYSRKCLRYQENLDATDFASFQGHSGAFTVMDQYANAVCIVHSLNSMPFGTGLFVDGIALSDATTANIGQLRTTNLESS